MVPDLTSSGGCHRPRRGAYGLIGRTRPPVRTLA